ncbi:hypothetical protein BpHYR1_011234 [Brachionus plicatilis]|uniref:Uncharacterized protein n=1 Tax=Brachionus plicatilis TaxID=10195 RepID=A0A3M7SP49_BRAPC|nr:hypothetical protein BpHYR1_011234 [Brachionus plicatilis]
MSNFFRFFLKNFTNVKHMCPMSNYVFFGVFRSKNDLMIYLKENINYLKKVEINLKIKQNFFILPFLNSILIAKEVFTGQQQKNSI